AVRNPGTILAVPLSLAGAFLCGCSGMGVWDRPYVAAHRSPPAPATSRAADLPPPAHTPAPPPPAAGSDPARSGDGATADHREILTDPTLVDAGFSRVGDYFTGDFGTPMPTAPRAAAPVLRSCAPAPSH